MHFVQSFNLSYYLDRCCGTHFLGVEIKGTNDVLMSLAKYNAIHPIFSKN